MARQYIGPKVQTQVDDEIVWSIKEEALKRGVTEAVVVREIIEAGVVARKTVDVRAMSVA